MILKNILSNLNPVEVIKAFRKSDTRVMGKDVFKMGGSGVLIPTGLTLITDGVANQSWYEIVGGAIVLAAGCVLAVMLANKVEEIKNGEK